MRSKNECAQKVMEILGTSFNSVIVAHARKRDAQTTPVLFRLEASTQEWLQREGVTMLELRTHRFISTSLDAGETAPSLNVTAIMEAAQKFKAGGAVRTPDRLFPKRPE